jgi:hypothetical protein
MTTTQNPTNEQVAWAAAILRKEHAGMSPKRADVRKAHRIFAAMPAVS